MKKKNGTDLLAAGVLAGMLIGAPSAQAAMDYLKALPTTYPIFVDRQQAEMEAYSIDGTTYVKLWDIGEAVGFNVYWQDGGVQIDSATPYTGQSPAEKADLDAVRADMIQRINQIRSAHGAPALNTNRSLMDAAQECSDKLFTWHHNREECEAVAAHGYPYGFGSNITVFTGTATADIAQRAVENWTNSPGHFQTMIDPACDSIGVGVTEDGCRTFCYMFVGNPNSNNPYG